MATCCSSSASSNLNGSAAPPFVIPTVVEGSAVRPSDLPNLPYQASTPNTIVIPTERSVAVFLVLPTTNTSQKTLARSGVVNNNSLDLKRRNRYGDLSSTRYRKRPTLRLLHEVGQGRRQDPRRHRQGDICTLPRPFVETYQQPIPIVGLFHRRPHHVVLLRLNKREAARQTPGVS